MSNLVVLALIVSVVFALTGAFAVVLLRGTDNTAGWPSISEFTHTDEQSGRDRAGVRDSPTGGDSDSEWVFDK